MTKTSFTAMQAMVSMPFSLRAEDLDLKPGRCSLEQVGVKAPGTEKRATFFLEKRSDVVRGAGPEGVMMVKVPEGRVSPTLIVMMVVEDCFPYKQF